MYFHRVESPHKGKLQPESTIAQSVASVHIPIPYTYILKKKTYLPTKFKIFCTRPKEIIT